MSQWVFAMENGESWWSVERVCVDIEGSLGAMVKEIRHQATRDRYEGVLSFLEGTRRQKGDQAGPVPVRGRKHTASTSVTPFDCIKNRRWLDRWVD